MIFLPHLVGADGEVAAKYVMNRQCMIKHLVPSLFVILLFVMLYIMVLLFTHAAHVHITALTLYIHLMVTYWLLGDKTGMQYSCQRKYRIIVMQLPAALVYRHRIFFFLFSMWL